VDVFCYFSYHYVVRCVELKKVLCWVESILWSIIFFIKEGRVEIE
jgi:hypothetical protein